MSHIRCAFQKWCDNSPQQLVATAHVRSACSSGGLVFDGTSKHMPRICLVRIVNVFSEAEQVTFRKKSNNPMCQCNVVSSVAGMNPGLEHNLLVI